MRVTYVLRSQSCLSFLFFFSICLLILQREKGRERETLMWGKNIDQLLPIHDWTYNLGVCPDGESNPQHFGVWDSAPTKWATLTKAGVVFLVALLCQQKSEKGEWYLTSVSLNEFLTVESSILVSVFLIYSSTPDASELLWLHWRSWSRLFLAQNLTQKVA